jgi:hypothetical protein
MMILGSNPGRNKKFFSSPIRPDQLWGPHNLLFNGHGDFLHGGKEVGA